jgi:hypothetical protein
LHCSRQQSHSPVPQERRGASCPHFFVFFVGFFFLVWFFVLFIVLVSPRCICHAEAVPQLQGLRLRQVQRLQGYLWFLSLLLPLSLDHSILLREDSLTGSLVQAATGAPRARPPTAAARPRASCAAATAAVLARSAEREL